MDCELLNDNVNVIFRFKSNVYKYQYIGGAYYMDINDVISNVNPDNFAMVYQIYAKYMIPGTNLIDIDTSNKIMIRGTNEFCKIFRNQMLIYVVVIYAIHREFAVYMLSRFN